MYIIHSLYINFFSHTLQCPIQLLLLQIHVQKRTIFTALLQQPSLKFFHLLIYTNKLLRKHLIFLKNHKS